MKLKDIKIDTKKTLNGKTLLTSVTPSYVYDKGKRTEQIIAYKYEVALPGRMFDKIVVKIDGEKKIEQPDGYQEVSFEGLEMFLYWYNGEYVIGATATDIHAVTPKS